MRVRGEVVTGGMEGRVALLWLCLWLCLYHFDLRGELEAIVGNVALDVPLGAPPAPRRPGIRQGLLDRANNVAIPELKFDLVVVARGERHGEMRKGDGFLMVVMVVVVVVVVGAAADALSRGTVQEDPFQGNRVFRGMG